MTLREWQQIGEQPLVRYKVFDVEGRKFSTVTCDRCMHTEFFKADRSALANIFDLFVT
jgi:predicted nucleic-acid-binding Zn-ribbon protein